jgi:hypothetical protein
MTKEELTYALALRPGPELDVLVSRLAFELPKCEFTVSDLKRAQFWVGHVPPFYTCPACGKTHNVVSSYSRDWVSFGKLVERLGQRGYGVEMATDPEGGGEIRILHHGTGGTVAEGAGSSVPYALCQAVLRAFSGVER